MSIELKTNQTIESILNNHRVWQKRKPLISNALKKHSYQKLQKLLLRLGRIDRSLKGMDNLDVYDELQNVVISYLEKAMDSIAELIKQIGEKARSASNSLRIASTSQKNNALISIANQIQESKQIYLRCKSYRLKRC